MKGKKDHIYLNNNHESLITAVHGGLYEVVVRSSAVSADLDLINYRLTH